MIFAINKVEIKKKIMLKNREEIQAWLDKNVKVFKPFSQENGNATKVENPFKINNDLSVDVVGDIGRVVVKSEGLKELPVQFGSVDGGTNSKFHCSYGDLITIVGAPKVCGMVDFSNNKITSIGGLEDCEYDYLDISNNKIVSLIECPQMLSVLKCAKNPLTSLDGAPKDIKYLVSSFSQKDVDAYNNGISNPFKKSSYTVAELKEILNSLDEDTIIEGMKIKIAKDKIKESRLSKFRSSNTTYKIKESINEDDYVSLVYDLHPIISQLKEHDIQKIKIDKDEMDHNDQYNVYATVSVNNKDYKILFYNIHSSEYDDIEKAKNGNKRSLVLIKDSMLSLSKSMFG